jgi:hypothetical protein
MKTLLLSMMLALALPCLAAAADFKLPSDAPVATVSIPDAWSPKAYADNGVEANSDDGKVYLAIEVAAGGSVDDAIKETVAFLQKSGVTVDDSTMKQDAGKVNGMDGAQISWDGKDKDGPTRVSLTFIAPSADKMLLVTYWATTDGAEKNSKALEDILASLQPVK